MTDVTSASIAHATATRTLRQLLNGLLSPNEGKRAGEKCYFWFFIASLPIQALVAAHLTYAPGKSNDAILTTQGVIMALGPWLGSLVFRARVDRGKPFYQVYGFKLGCFLAGWAMIGGYLGTDPWYTVLHAHFGFNTSLNPNGIPLFMIPMTMGVFGFYTVILGAIFRVTWRTIGRQSWAARIPSGALRVALLIPIACIIPVVETAAYHSRNYCFDNSTGMWWMNIVIYGTWQFAALLFYPRFDEKPGEDQPVQKFIVSGLAAVAIILFTNQIFTEFIAPHLTTVGGGKPGIDDWSSNNCLGRRP